MEELDIDTTKFIKERDAAIVAPLILAYLFRHVIMKAIYNTNIKKAIVDFKNLTSEILAIFAEKFPNGYSDRDIIKVKNTRNETVEAIEILTGDTKYLVKVNAKLEKIIEDYDEEDYKDFESDDPVAIQDVF